MKKLHRNILKSLVLVGALALSGTAMASTFNVGELSTYTQSVNWPIGLQSDTYNFTIPVLSNNAEAVASVNFDFGTLGSYHISGLSLGVYDSDDTCLAAPVSALLALLPLAATTRSFPEPLTEPWAAHMR